MNKTFINAGRRHNMIDCLMDAGSEVNHLYAASARDGATAYHRAVQAADKPSCLSLLLTADPAAVNVQDSSGLSPLHLACKLNHRTTVKKLLVRVIVVHCCVPKKHIGIGAVPQWGLGGVLISLTLAVEPVGGWTTESVTHGQCDARPTVTFLSLIHI